MFEQELSALLDVVAYIEDEELREELRVVINNTAQGIEYRRKRAAEKQAADDAGLCRFDEAWRGRCNKPSVNEARTLCLTHLHVTCRATGCTNHAILTCPQSLGAFVCGAPVCKKHRFCNGKGVHS